MAVEATTNVGRVMFAPGGVHHIHAGIGAGGSASVTLRITPETAAVLNASLALNNHLHKPQRTFFDREHEGKEALAWPISFEWSETPEPGVYTTVEYSSLGRYFVEGRVFRAISPQIHTDADLPKRGSVQAKQHYDVTAGRRGSKESPAMITALDFPFGGTFTNNPAFRQILPLWS